VISIERFVNLFKHFLFFSIVFAFIAISLEAKPPVNPKLPEAVTVVSQLTNIEDDIRAVSFDHSFTSGHEKVLPNVDLIQRTAHNIQNFVNGKDWFSMWKEVPQNRKILVIKAYEIGDPRIEEALAYARENKIRGVMVISDGNIVYAPGAGQFQADGEGQREAKYSSDWIKAKATTSSSGKLMQNLLTKHGFSFDPNAPYSISLAPLGNKNLIKMLDIMHEKQVIYVITDSEGNVIDARWEEGSNNLNPNPRINMRIEHNDPLGALYAYERAMAMRDAFTQGLPIKGTAAARPRRIKYIDPTDKDAVMFQEIAMTDGQTNWNWRIAQRLYESVGKNKVGETLSPEEARLLPQTEFTEITFADFVETFEPSIFALGAVIEKFPAATAMAIGDGQFLYPLGFGDFGLLAGFPTIPPFGPMRLPINGKTRERIKTFGFIKANPHQPDREPEGPPIGRTVMHLKFKGFRGKENGRTFVELFDGSLNLSNHFANAETQTWRRFKGDSKLGGAIIDAVRQLEVTEKEAMIPGDIAIFAEIIAHLLGRSPLDIEVPWVKAQIELAKQKDYAALENNILLLATTPSKNVDSKKLPPVELVNARLEGAKNFLEWYKDRTFYKAYKMNPIWLGVVTMLGLKLSEKEIRAVTTRRLIQFLLYEKNIDIEPRIAEAWKKLGITVPLPPPLKRVGTMLLSPSDPNENLSFDREEDVRRFLDSDIGQTLGLGYKSCGETLKML
jgi:hypothetical protein